MIASRVEKLKFLVDEMQLAFHLTMHLTDPFVARTLARHILIRTENFIEHARRLRRPLNDAGYATTTTTRQRKHTRPVSRNTSKFQEIGSARMCRISISANA
jgi:hypothetical protein